MRVIFPALPLSWEFAKSFLSNFITDAIGLEAQRTFSLGLKMLFNSLKCNPLDKRYITAPFSKEFALLEREGIHTERKLTSCEFVQEPGVYCSKAAVAFSYRLTNLGEEGITMERGWLNIFYDVSLGNFLTFYCPNKLLTYQEHK